MQQSTDIKINKLKVAIFPHQIDTLFVDNSNLDIEIFYLVRNASPEHEWVKSFTSETFIINYTLNSDKNLCDQGIDEILLNSNIDFKLTELGIKDILLVKITKDANTWAVKNNVNLITTAYTTREILEHKIFFDNLLAENNLPKPKSQIVTKDNIESIVLEDKRYVLQDPDSMGGEGTYFAKTKEEIKELVNENPFVPEFLLREFVKGEPYGISTFISKDKIFISGIRLQCYDQNAYHKKDIFCGIDWVPKKNVPPELFNKLNNTFTLLCIKLAEQKHFGLINFDFLMDETTEEINIIECNARFSGATIHTVLEPLLNCNQDLFKLILEVNKNKPELVEELSVEIDPTTNFEGSTLLINFYPSSEKQKLTINNRKENGLYEMDGNRNLSFIDSDIRNYKSYKDKKIVIFYSDAKNGETYNEYSTLATIVTNFSLYNKEGSKNEGALKLMEYFKFEV